LISEEIAPIVNAALQAAHLHGASVDLTELAKLLPQDTTSEDLTAALESLPHLQGRYLVRDGLVLPKSGASSTPSADEEARNRSIASIWAALVFASRLGSRDVSTIAVSGSTSYLSASEQDDLDLFCVTHEGSMWVFLLRALVTTRVLKFFDRRTPPVTFSCVMDWEYADEMFSRDRGALFARDALMARVVLGCEGYSALLQKASWMKRYFPMLYGHQRAGLARLRPTERAASGPGRMLNMVLYLAAGSFIRLKALFHNHMLARQGKDSALFRVRMGPNHLIYESKRYTALRSMYSKVAPVRQAFDADQGAQSI